MTVAEVGTVAVTVTYRRLRSGRTHQMTFDCGTDNAAIILKEARNTNSEILTVNPAL